MATIKELIEKAGQVAVLKAHPVGSYFITEEDRNPAEILGLGGVSTWVKLEGRVLLGASSAYPVGSEGGEATHKLSVNEMPAHQHDYRLFTQLGSTNNDAQQGKFMTAIQNAGASEAFLCGPGKSREAHIMASGGNQAHNNLQPYRSAYIWRRTA